MPRARPFVWLLFVTAALAGCAALPPPTDIEAMPRPGAAHIVEYALVGRISLRHGQTNYAAKIDWQHGAASDEILLSTPLGQGIAELSRSAAGARLRTADQREFAAPDWESLALQMFGAELPLTPLARWLVADAPVAARRDAAGRPLSFSQGGWSVAYGRYESDAAAALPLGLEIVGEDIEMRLVVDAWQQVK